MKTTSVLFSASIIVCLIMACSIPLGGGGKSTVIRLDNIEISCSVPKKEYIVSDQLMKDDVASMTFECPALKTSNGYTVVPLFSMYIEKDRFSDEKAKAALDPVVCKNHCHFERAGASVRRRVYRNGAAEEIRRHSEFDLSGNDHEREIRYPGGLPGAERRV
jgi:hypothetical protein